MTRRLFINCQLSIITITTIPVHPNQIAKSMLSSSSAGTIPPPRDRINGNGSQMHDHDNTTRPRLEPSASTSSSRSRVFDRLKPWKSTSVAGRRKSTLFSSKKENDLVAGDPYVEQAVASTSTSTTTTGPSASPGRRSVDGYEWEEGSEDETPEADAYSWIDPSIVGTSALGHSSSGEGEPRSPGAASSLLQGPVSPVVTRDPPHVSRLHMDDRLMIGSR
jgi:hypothetical protein